MSFNNHPDEAEPSPKKALGLAAFKMQREKEIKQFASQVSLPKPTHHRSVDIALPELGTRFISP